MSCKIAIIGGGAIGAAAAVSGDICESTEEAGQAAKQAAAIGFKTAEKIFKKAELADIAGDEAIEAASKALQEAGPNLTR